MPSTPEERIQAQTRAMFTRVVSGWAMDLLELRRTGLIVPSAREGVADPVMPSAEDHGPLTLDRFWPTRDVAASLHWRPARRAA